MRGVNVCHLDKISRCDSEDGVSWCDSCLVGLLQVKIVESRIFEKTFVEYLPHIPNWRTWKPAIRFEAVVSYGQFYRWTREPMICWRSAWRKNRKWHKGHMRHWWVSRLWVSIFFEGIDLGFLIQKIELFCRLLKAKTLYCTVWFGLLDMWVGLQHIFGKQRAFHHQELQLAVLFDTREPIWLQPGAELQVGRMDFGDLYMWVEVCRFGVCRYLAKFPSKQDLGGPYFWLTGAQQAPVGFEFFFSGSFMWYGWWKRQEVSEYCEFTKKNEIGWFLAFAHMVDASERMLTFLLLAHMVDADHTLMAILLGRMDVWDWGWNIKGLPASKCSLLPLEVSPRDRTICGLTHVSYSHIVCA